VVRNGCIQGLTPIVTVKLQLQSQKSVSERQFKGPVDCAKQIVRVQGFGGLWSGFTGSLAFRSNFFWMFLSFEVCDFGVLLDIYRLNTIGQKGFDAWLFKPRRDAISGIPLYSQGLTAHLENKR